jgi:hypothetical protein
VSADVSPALPRPSFVRRHRVKFVLFGVLASAVGGVALWIFVTLKFAYSTGDRVGYVQKFSRKGWVCRTWEGELAMTPVPGSAPQIFEFTVPDPAVAKRLGEAEGKQVALHYEEKKGIPSSCFGDTHYFVTDVRVLSR